MKTNVGCCTKAKLMTEENKKMRQQLSIAFKALEKYQSGPKPEPANKAVQEILAIGPVSEPAQT